MSKKFFITIEIDEEGHTINIKDGAGNEKSLQSIMLFGGDAKSGQWYQFGWGSSADSAWALAQGMKQAYQSGNAAYINFYKQLACHMAQAINPEEFQKIVDAEEVLDRWTREDQNLKDKIYSCACPIGGPCICKTFH